MEISKEKLIKKYSEQSTEALMEISLKDLTPMAREALDAELATRNVDYVELEQLKKKTEIRKAKIEKANSRLASRDKRFLAQIIDTLIACAFLPLLYFGYWGWIAGWSLFVFYIWFADGLLIGRSIGKFVLHMRVIVAKDGGPCSYFRSFIRNVSLTLLGPIDWLFILGNDRQRLGDKIAGTVVVNSIAE